MHSPSPARHGALAVPAAPMTIRPRRLVLAAVLAALAAAPGDLGALTRGLMQDAFVQVSVFVAATLLIFYGLERLFRFDLGLAMGNARAMQVPIAAFLGATPGCGGAVVVVAAYASGKVSFGAVVATLTATMGDAAFLLIATRPDAALVLLPAQVAVGILTGWLIDRFVRTDDRHRGGSCDIVPAIGRLRARDLAYLAPVVPGLVVGAAQIGGVQIDAILGLPAGWIGLAGAFAGLAIWTASRSEEAHV